jgi:hypothetical protein
MENAMKKKQIKITELPSKFDNPFGSSYMFTIMDNDGNVLNQLTDYTKKMGIDRCSLWIEKYIEEHENADSRKMESTLDENSSRDI